MISRHSVRVFDTYCICSRFYHNYYLNIQSYQTLYSTTINFRKEELSIHISSDNIFSQTYLKKFLSSHFQLNIWHHQKCYIAQNSILILAVLIQIKYIVKQIFSALLNIIKKWIQKTFRKNWFQHKIENIKITINVSETFLFRKMLIC